jgi:hypothetical protein
MLLLLLSLVLLLEDWDAEKLVLFFQSASCCCCCRAWCCCWRIGTLRNLCCFSRALHAVVVAEPGAVAGGAGRQGTGAVFSESFMLLLLQGLVLLLKERDALELVLFSQSISFCFVTKPGAVAGGAGQ